MRLLLIRHGETDWNVDARIQGISDIPLNAKGRQQAEWLGWALRLEPLAAVYTSPLQRARDTSERVARYHGLQVQAHAGLSELDQGVLEGVLAKDLRDHPAGILQAWEAGDMAIVIPGGESMEELQRRAWQAVQQIQTSVDSGATVVVVSHSLTTKAIICSALGLPLVTYRRLQKANGSLSLLDLQPSHNVLIRLNDVSHLAPADAASSHPTTAEAPIPHA